MCMCVYICVCLDPILCLGELDNESGVVSAGRDGLIHIRDSTLATVGSAIDMAENIEGLAHKILDPQIQSVDVLVSFAVPG